MSIADRMVISSAFKVFKHKCRVELFMNMMIDVVIICGLIYLFWGGMNASLFTSLFSSLPTTAVYYAYIIAVILAILAICLILKNLLKVKLEESQAIKYANYKIKHPNIYGRDVPVMRYYHIHVTLPDK